MNTKFWSFNRLRDGDNISTLSINWKGPFSWPNFESKSNLLSIPDMEGVYLFTLEYLDGYVIYSVGMTNSTRRRINDHTKAFLNGKYNVFDIAAGKRGERKEIWHGWNYRKENPDEFERNKDSIRTAVKEQLFATRIFIGELKEERLRRRLEAAIVLQIYCSKEPWSELVDRGMFLNGRYNNEMPILIKNKTDHKIYGLPNELEI